MSVRRRFSSCRSVNYISSITVPFPVRFICVFPFRNICFILRAALFGSGARIYADTTLVPLGRAVRGLFPNDIPRPLRARGSFGVVALPIYSWARGHPGALWQFKVSIATICK